MGLDRRVPEDEFMQWLVESCDASGVELKVTDPEVMRRVGILLGKSSGADRAQGAPAPSTARTQRAS